MHDPQSPNSPAPQDSYLRRLMHRWLVEYNPLYLLSAALVLGGVIVISHELAQVHDARGQLGVAVIAEIYAWALVGGAAFLQRIRLRRPAVMLALLAALYQGDLALHTETCAYLGLIGVIGTLAWLGSFVAKLHALAWALDVRLSRSARAVPTFGALGLAAIPHLFPLLDASALTVVTTLWVFALIAAGLWTSRTITSKVPLDDWGRVVMHRASLAIWLLWVLLLFAHAGLWANDGQIAFSPLVFATMLLATRWMQSEIRVWLTVAATLLATALYMPGATFLVALTGAGVLVLHAYRRPGTTKEVGDVRPPDPYRTPASPASQTPTPPPRASFDPAPAAARDRFLVGALVGLYAALWTYGWDGTFHLDHQVWLDVVLTVALGIVVLRRRRVSLLLPLVAVYGHLGVQSGVITAPETTMGWGTSAVGAGFVLLAACLWASWQSQRRAWKDQKT